MSYYDIFSLNFNIDINWCRLIHCWRYHSPTHTIHLILKLCGTNPYQFSLWRCWNLWEFPKNFQNNSLKMLNCFLFHALYKRTRSTWLRSLKFPVLSWLKPSVTIFLLFFEHYLHFPYLLKKKIYCYQLGIDLLLHYPSKNKPTPILLQYSGSNTGFQEIMLIILKNSSKIALKLLSLISLVLKAQLTQKRDYLLTSQIALDLVIKIYVLE